MPCANRIFAREREETVFRRWFRVPGAIVTFEDGNTIEQLRVIVNYPLPIL